MFPSLIWMRKKQVNDLSEQNKNQTEEPTANALKPATIKFFTCIHCHNEVDKKTCSKY